jgi:hypothetical protein
MKRLVHHYLLHTIAELNQITLQIYLFIGLNCFKYHNTVQKYVYKNWSLELPVIDSTTARTMNNSKMFSPTCFKFKILISKEHGWKN